MKILIITAIIITIIFVVIYIKISASRSIRKKLKVLEESLKTNNDDPDLLGEIGFKYMIIGEYKEAINALQRAYDLKPMDAKIRQNLAKVLFWQGCTLSEKGEYQASISYFDRANRIDPSNANWHNKLGNAWFKTGNESTKKDPMQYVDKSYLRKAISEYETAIKLNPNHKKAKKNLDRVKLFMNNVQNV